LVMAACPAPMEKIAGATGLTWIVCWAFAPARFGRFTVTLAEPGGISAGICALIWKGRATSWVAVSPFTWTTGVAPAVAKPVPKIEISPPGAICAVKLAALSTPEGLIFSASGASAHCEPERITSDEDAAVPLNGVALALAWYADVRVRDDHEGKVELRR